MNGNAPECKSRPLKYSDDRPFRIHLLLQALFDSKACFLLGAGASYGLVPLRPNRESTIQVIRERKRIITEPVDSEIRRYFMQVHFGVESDFKSSTFDYLCSVYRQTAEKHIQECEVREAWSVPPWEIDCWYTRCFKSKPQKGIPPAYSLFRSLPRTAKVVTWNYDRLASQYCPQEVLSMHGLVSTFSEIYDQMIGPFCWSTRSLYSSQKIIVPGEREDMDKLDEQNLTKFENWIKNATSIIMIGYRFGWGDDQESWRVFCENVGPSVPVHVVDPNDTQHIAGQIGHGLRRFERCNGIYSLSKTKSILTTIIGQPFSWANLAEVLFMKQPLFSWFGHETTLVNTYDRKSLYP